MNAGMFGRYQIVSQLGRGAMGTVYRAIDPAIERTVAIKTLDPERLDDNLDELKERFLREAKSAGRLNHPNVVTVYEVGEAGGVAYIAMEYLEGQSLRQLLDKRQFLPAHTISEVIAQIADALDYAQRFGIVHRDIKPANIMVSPAGHAKLTDFGVAHMPASTMTQVGMVLGSPKYLSPEQVRGLPVDGRADIFALGVVLFEMLTGRTPFEAPGTSVYDLMERICTRPAPRVTDVNREAPPAFDAIVARALAKHAGERYQRASDFANDLRNYRRLGPAPADGTIVARARGADATVVMRPEAGPGGALPSRPSGRDPELDREMARLLADLDQFSLNLEQEERRLAEAARARAEATGAGSAGKTPPDPEASRPRSALIGLLREQAQAKNREQTARPSLEAALALSARLRQAFNYLAEFARELNAATPGFAGTFTLPHAGALPQPTLGGGFADYRTRKLEDREVMEYVILTCHLRSGERVGVTLNKDEARALKVRLERAGMRHEEREVEHAFHRLPRVALSIECDLAASARLRADYDALAVEIHCLNVGTLGPARYRIAAAQFDENLVEEFGRCLLGLPNRFAERRLPAP